MADHVEYDCSPWAGETRRVLRAMLEEQSIPHAFQGTVLVVPAELQETVDDLVEIALRTESESIGSDDEVIAYDISSWSGESQNTIVDSLVDSSIAHEWDAHGHLVIAAEFSEHLDELLEEMGEPDGGDELSGLELNERLSSLFVLADRLCNDSHDRKARKRIPKAAALVRRVATPFGVEPAEWKRVQESTADLALAITAADGAGAPDESDPVKVAAVDLRDRLRRFV